MSGSATRRFAFSLTPVEAEALLRVVDASLAVVVRNRDVPRHERSALGAVRNALLAIVESPEFILQKVMRPPPRPRRSKRVATAEVGP